MTPNDPPRERDENDPQCIVLGPRSGAAASPKPPVRLFLASEPAQYRAERVFLWSIEQVRDPGRVYEIHLLKGLAGFRTRFWNTGFTNYRFAVPHFANGQGKALYNDVDQIYLADPGELFDLELGGHGYLAVSETDTSVMLLDCGRMAKHWTLAAAQRHRKYALIRRAQGAEGCYGPLPPEWNARDPEYVEGRSKLLHYTIIHKQPWRPFPERFLYQPNPRAALWHDLERSADRVGFQIFHRERPSRRYFAYRKAKPSPRTGSRPEAMEEAIRSLARRSKASSLLELEAGDGGLVRAESQLPGGCCVERMGLLAALHDSGSAQPRDAVVCTAGLDEIPVEDLPWAVESLFRRARRFVFAAGHCDPPPRRRYTQSPTGAVRQPEWWKWIFESAAARWPGVHWQLALSRRPGLQDGDLWFLQGGAYLGTETPSVWVLTDHKPGHATQSIGLAEELGWPYRRLDLEFSPMAELPNFVVGTRLLGLKPSCAKQLAPPWPDLVIATGRRTAPVAAWIQAQSLGRTWTVQMGRMGAVLGDSFDLVVAPAYACVYPDPRRIETAAPITRVNPTELEYAAVQWKKFLDRFPPPRIGLLVGGSDPAHDFTPGVARRLGREVAEAARRVGGSVFVTTSRRTSRAAAAALEQTLGDALAHFHRWAPRQSLKENPYMGYLALTDWLVVTGESASMLAEACATEKPVYIYPLPEISKGLKGLAVRPLWAIADAIASRAYAQPTNRRGIERPQRGIELLCAKLVAGGWVRPSRHIQRLHRSLVERKLARYFDGTFSGAPARSHSEVREVADRVRGLLGLPDST